MVPSLLLGLSLFAVAQPPPILEAPPPDAAEVALEIGEAVGPPAPAPTLRERAIAPGELTGPPSPPPALVPYQSSIPSLAIIDLDQPRNAWVPAASGSLFALLGAQQVALFREQARIEDNARRFGPPLEETDWVARAARPDPRREEIAGWAGVGFGIGAIVGAAVTYRWGEDAPFRVEPFAGPTAGGIGFTTRF